MSGGKKTAPTQRIDVSVAKAYAEAKTLVPAALDRHRIAPHEEVELDPAALGAQLAGADDGHIDAALAGHALFQRRPFSGGLGDETMAVRPRRVPSPTFIGVVTVMALGLAVGMGFALAIG